MSVDFSAGDTGAQLEHAEFFASEFGWRVLPCYSVRNGRCSCKLGADCPSPGKHPRTRHGVWDADDRPDVIRRWWERWPTANVAIATGHGLVVIDIDPRNGGYESLGKLEAKLGRLPRIMTVATGGGGEHFYLAVPSDARIKSINLAPGVDIKAEGGYVIAPPSTHIGGSQYVWASLAIAGPPEPLVTWFDQLPRAVGPRPCDLPEAKSRRRSPRPRNTTKATLEQGRRKPGSRTITVSTSKQSPTPKPRKTICATLPVSDGLLNPFSISGKRVWAACRRCLVTESGTTNRRIRALATSLRNIPALQTLSATALLPAIRWWWEQGAQFMCKSEWSVTKQRWEYLWNAWTDPETGPAWRARDNVAAGRLVQEAERFKKPALVILAGLCEEMQSQAGDQEWYLAWRTVVDVLASLGYEVPLATVGRWLRRLVNRGMLVHTREHRRGSLLAQYFMTAEAAARVAGNAKLDSGSVSKRIA